MSGRSSFAGTQADQSDPIESTDAAQPAQTDDERAASEAAARKTAEGPFVKYTGPETGSGSYAEITAAQWGEAGIAAKSSETSVWKLQNNWQLPASDFSDEQIKVLTEKDGRFVLVGGEK